MVSVGGRADGRSWGSEGVVEGNKNRSRRNGRGKRQLVTRKVK